MNFKYRNNLSDVTLEVVDINNNQTPCGDDINNNQTPCGDEKRVDSIYLTSINLSDCQGSRSHSLSVRIEITELRPKIPSFFSKLQNWLIFMFRMRTFA